METGESAVEKFCKMTSMHGINCLYSTASITLKIFWAIILLFAMAGLVLVLKETISNFVDTPTATKVSMKLNPNMEFPGVLVCQTKSVGVDYLEQKNISKKLGMYIQGILTNSFEGPNQGEQGENEKEESALMESRYQALLDNYTNRDIRQFFFEAGPKCEDLFTQCSFKRKQFNCCEDVVSVKFDKTFGKCFLFHASIRQTMQGVGLKLKIRTDLDKFLPSPEQESDGLSISVFPTYDAVSLSKQLITLGKETVLELKQQDILLNNNIFKSVCKDQSSYATTLVCEMECSHRLMLQHCNCSYPLDLSAFPLSENRSTYEHFPICSPAQMLSCEPEKFLDSCLDVQCPLACLKQWYNILSSSTNLAKDQQQFTVVQVHFSHFLVISMTQVETLTLVSVIGNIGGVMGVFIGASLITCVELLVFCIATLLKQCKRE